MNDLTQLALLKLIRIVSVMCDPTSGVKGTSMCPTLTSEDIEPQTANGHQEQMDRGQDGGASFEAPLGVILQGAKKNLAPLPEVVCNGFATQMPPSDPPVPIPRFGAQEALGPPHNNNIAAEAAPSRTESWCSASSILSTGLDVNNDSESGTSNDARKCSNTGDTVNIDKLRQDIIGELFGVPTEELVMLNNGQLLNYPSEHSIHYSGPNLAFRPSESECDEQLTRENLRQLDGGKSTLTALWCDSHEWTLHRAARSSKPSACILCDVLFVVTHLHFFRQQ